jgi:uncharacterized membrane protein
VQICLSEAVSITTRVRRTNREMHFTRTRNTNFKKICWFLCSVYLLLLLLMLYCLFWVFAFFHSICSCLAVFLLFKKFSIFQLCISGALSYYYYYLLYLPHPFFTSSLPSSYPTPRYSISDPHSLQLVLSSQIIPQESYWTDRLRLQLFLIDSNT